MGGHIDCYIDCSSFYSYLTLTYLFKNRALLKGYDIDVEFYPVFLGGINHGSGNKPPWTLPAKAKYGNFDTDRAKKYHNMTEMSPPPFFPPVTLLPQRALCYIKATYSPSIFEDTYLALCHAMWVKHINITQSEELAKTLEATKLFTSDQVTGIIAATGEKTWKDALLANTQTVLNQGVFGAPWMWVRNAKGVEEPFFGSDRFHFMWEFLGIPWRDIEIIPNTQDTASKSRL